MLTEYGWPTSEVSREWEKRSKAYHRKHLRDKVPAGAALPWLKPLEGGRWMLSCTGPAPPLESAEYVTFTRTHLLAPPSLIVFLMVGPSLAPFTSCGS